LHCQKWQKKGWMCIEKNMHACGAVQRSTHTVITLTAFCILRQRERERERERERMYGE